jgi:tetratricopeptide (TPR) repeat protein
MTKYLEIFYPEGSSCNRGLIIVIIYIAKHYGKQANLECGIRYIAKHLYFGSLEDREEAIYRMIKSKKITNSKNRKWRYHRRIYGEAYEYIVKLLRNCPRNVVKNLLNDIHNELGTGNKLEQCSDAILYWQKKMLKLHISDPNVSIYNKEDAKKILDKINDVDKHFPLLLDNGR